MTSAFGKLIDLEDSPPQASKDNNRRGNQNFGINSLSLSHSIPPEAPSAADSNPPPNLMDEICLDIGLAVPEQPFTSSTTPTSGRLPAITQPHCTNLHHNHAQQDETSDNDDGWSVVPKRGGRSARSHVTRNSDMRNLGRGQPSSRADSDSRRTITRGASAARAVSRGLPIRRTIPAVQGVRAGRGTNQFRGGQNTLGSSTSRDSHRSGFRGQAYQGRTVGRSGHRGAIDGRGNTSQRASYDRSSAESEISSSYAARARLATASSATWITPSAWTNERGTVKPTGLLLPIEATATTNPSLDSPRFVTGRRGESDWMVQSNTFTVSASNENITAANNSPIPLTREHLLQSEMTQNAMYGYLTQPPSTSYPASSSKIYGCPSEANFTDESLEDSEFKESEKNKYDTPWANSETPDAVYQLPRYFDAGIMNEWEPRAQAARHKNEKPSYSAIRDFHRLIASRTNEMVSKIAADTGVRISIEVVAGKGELWLHGDTELDSAQTRIDEWVKANTRPPESKWGKTYGFEMKDWYSHEKELAKELNALRFKLPVPEGEDLQFQAFSRWPDTEIGTRPEQAFGSNLAALDPIRTDCRTYILLIPTLEGAIFKFLSNDKEKMGQAKRRLEAMYEVVKAKFFEAESFSVLVGLGPEHNNHRVKMEDHHTTKRGASSLQQPEMVPHLVERNGFRNGHRRITEEQLENLQRKLYEPFQRSRYYRGAMDFRVRLGKFIVQKYKPIPSDGCYDLPSFVDMVGHPQFQSYVTKNIGSRTYEDNVRERILSADHILMSPAWNSGGLRGIDPNFKCIFVLGNWNPHQGNIVFEVDYGKQVGVDNVYHRTGERWFKLDRGKEEPDVMLDGRLVDLKDQLAWQFSLTKTRALKGRSVPAAYAQWASQIIMDQEIACCETETREFFRWSRSPAVPVISVQMIRSWDYGIQSTDYVLELEHNIGRVENGARLSREPTRIKPFWTLQVKHQDWILKADKTKSPGWADALDQMFPPDGYTYRRRNPDARKSGQGSQLAEGPGESTSRDEHAHADAAQAPDPADLPPSPGLKVLVDLLWDIKSLVAGSTTAGGDDAALSEQRDGVVASAEEDVSEESDNE